MAGNTYKDLQNSHPCFGGVKKLHSTIENALKVIDADLYVVLTGCIPEIVGDDNGEVVSQFEDADKPVIYAATAGFKGNNYKGHEQIIDAIIDQYLEKSEDRQKGLVNIWADVPYQDLFWLGNIRELEKLLEEIGKLEEELNRYERQMILPEVGTDGQNKLKKASVLIIGAGGLGSPVALYLAAAGVGRIGIADADKVSISNLQRQIVHSIKNIGVNKAESAREGMEKVNDKIKIETYPYFVTAENISEITDVYLRIFRRRAVSRTVGRPELSEQQPELSAVYRRLKRLSIFWVPASFWLAKCWFSMA